MREISHSAATFRWSCQIGMEGGSQKEGACYCLVDQIPELAKHYFEMHIFTADILIFS